MRAWLLSAKVAGESPRQKRDIAQIRRKSRWVMENLSRMRGSIKLDGNEVCHVALPNKTRKERERGRRGGGGVGGTGRSFWGEASRIGPLRKYEIPGPDNRSS